MASIYEYEVLNIKGEKVKMSDFEGKVIIIVNTASKCGFTPQFEGLEKIYKDYSDQGLVILGFPCNQFLKQDPGSNSEIESFCSLNYGVTFPMFAKIDVNGEDAHPLYDFLKSQAKGMLGSSAIKWNFTKFLIAKDGSVIDRYAPNAEPESMLGDIEKALA